MDARSRTTRERSPRAFIIVFVIIALFGAFCFFQRPVVAPESPLLVAPTPAQQNSQQPTVSDLEANAVNIQIPSFENVL